MKTNKGRWQVVGGGTVGKTFLMSRPKPEGEVLSRREEAHMRR
jgi:hypothetical protein